MFELFSAVVSIALTLSLAKLALGERATGVSSWLFWILPPLILLGLWILLLLSVDFWSWRGSWLYWGAFVGSGLWILSAIWVVVQSRRVRRGTPHSDG